LTNFQNLSNGVLINKSLKPFSQEVDPFAQDSCMFQIGQVRLHIDIKTTKEFYTSLPKISENCSCSDCIYFETEVIHQANSLFDLLKKMGVNLSRQPNITPDGLCCVGNTKQDKIGYLGYYFVYGKIGKTSKKTKVVNAENKVSEVGFNNSEFGKFMQVTIRQIEKDKLSFDFYIDADTKE
jgi:hypothetical protein